MSTTTAIDAKIEIVTRWVNDLFNNGFKSGWFGNKSTELRQENIDYLLKVIDNVEPMGLTTLINTLQSDCDNLSSYCGWSNSDIIELLSLFGFRARLELLVVWASEPDVQKKLFSGNKFLPLNQFLEPGAKLSPDRKYRYALWRTWDPEKAKINFIMLNPSTADEKKDDATIRRCKYFAKRWGYGGMIITNLFALRAKDPKELYSHEYPVSDPTFKLSLNDYWIELYASYCERSVFAWGAHGSFKGRNKKIIKLIPKAYCLGLTAKKQPKHPLYLLKTTPLEEFKCTTLVPEKKQL